MDEVVLPSLQRKDAPPPVLAVNVTPPPPQTNGLRGKILTGGMLITSTVTFPVEEHRAFVKVTE
jgi:hypothetical protein